MATARISSRVQGVYERYQDEEEPSVLHPAPTIIHPIQQKGESYELVQDHRRSGCRRRDHRCRSRSKQKILTPQ